MTVARFAGVFYSVDPQHGETAVGDAGTRFPLILRVHHSDEPSDACPLTLQNTLTGKINYLHEAQFEFLFCTLLSAQEPSGSFRHLIGVYWNTRWQYRFEKSGYRAKVNARGTGADIGMPFRVGHLDPRFASVVSSPSETQNCNAIFRAAIRAFNPGAPNRHESRVWTDYNVTAP